MAHRWPGDGRRRCRREVRFLKNACAAARLAAPAGSAQSNATKAGRPRATRARACKTLKSGPASFAQRRNLNDCCAPRALQLFVQFKRAALVVVEGKERERFREKSGPRIARTMAASARATLLLHNKGERERDEAAAVRLEAPKKRPAGRCGSDRRKHAQPQRGAL